MKVAQELTVLNISHNCHDCDLHSQDFFCRFSAKDQKYFETIKSTKVYPKGSKLFIEGQPSNGVFMLCQGKVKLSTCSREGKVIILEIAEAGDILGLSSSLSGVDHETTAEVVELCQINYVESSDLLRLLRSSSEASLNVARQLSRNYLTAYRQICSLGLSESVIDKLARLFLDWSKKMDESSGPIRLKSVFTHEEIAEMIGASRETVTRALKFFRERDLVTIKGSSLIIHDTQKLRAVIGNRGVLRTTL